MRLTLAVLLILVFRHACAQEYLLVTQEPVGLRVGPAAHMPAMETLPAQAVLQAVERSGGWYRVRVDHAVEGWVPVLATRLRPLQDVDSGQISGLHLERILTVNPRPEEAASIAQPVPSAYELRQFAASARLVPGSAR